jgi:hypothetical protein
MELKITDRMIQEANEIQESKNNFIAIMFGDKEVLDYQAASDVYWYLLVANLKAEIKELRETLKPSIN